MFDQEKTKAKAKAEFISVTEFAEQLGVHRVTVLKMIEDKKINAIKVGRVYRIHKSEAHRVMFGYLMRNPSQMS